jgi:hypothetical protein
VRKILLVVAVVTSLVVTSSHTPVSAAPKPVGAPGDMARIQLVSTTTQGGWRYEHYRNTAYPCSVSGYQTFTIATRVGTDPDAVAPLWVFMHGGGIGYFTPDGRPMPGTGQKVEETAELQRRNVLSGELKGRIADDPAGFRMMAVSMCDHDIYAGADVPDPNNPNRLPNGQPRTVNGLFATKAAVQYALGRYPTDDHFLYGGSAGSYGTYHVAWGLEEMGIAPTGIVADSGVMNIGWQEATFFLPECGRGEEASVEIPRRLHPDVIAPANNPDRLIADGRLTTPVADVFSVGDRGQCGEMPIECPVGGETITMGSVECMHEPLRRAIETQGSGSRSLSMDLCVRSDPPPAPACQTHVPSSKVGAVNTRAGWPADFVAVLVDWVHDRLDDDGSGPPVVADTVDSFAVAARTDLVGAAPARAVEATANARRAGWSKPSILGRLTTGEAWLTAIVDELYASTLGRPGDADGVAYWVGELAAGRRTVAQVSASFYASPEYHAGFGGGTDATWITDLYDELLGRAPEPGAVPYWVHEVSRTSRTQVALRFFQTPESAATRVAGLYDTLLGRAPAPADIAYWGPRVVAEGDLALAVSLAASAEYQTRAEQRFPPT